MSRTRLLFAAILLAGSTGLAAMASEPGAADEAPAERPDGHAPNTYRFGGAFTLAEASSASTCETQCDLTGKCEAWSFIPARLETAPRCELKYSIGKAIARPGAVSGIAGKYRVTPVDMTAQDELAGGPGTEPGAPSPKPETLPVYGPALPAGSAKAPTVYRGNELEGSASIIKTN